MCSCVCEFKSCGKGGRWLAARWGYRLLQKFTNSVSGKRSIKISSAISKTIVAESEKSLESFLTSSIKSEVEILLMLTFAVCVNCSIVMAAVVLFDKCTSLF